MPNGNKWDGLGQEGPPSTALTTPTLGPELTLGGYRDTLDAADNGREHGNCVIHELVIYDGALADTELRAVYTALRSKWQVTP
jgi:hypothetical protein